MINTINIYEVEGCRFDTFSEALAYEALCEEVKKIMSALQKRTEEVDNGEICITHDEYSVNESFKKFIKLCQKTLDPEGRGAKSFDDYIEKCRPSRTIIDRMISDCNIRCLCDAYYRFKCINFDSFREYQQPYYANHERDFFTEINL